MPSPPLSIVQSLSPRVAVLCSDDVTASCAANGCAGLQELFRPWEGGTERVSILSSTLTPTVHPSFPVRFVSHASVYSNPSAASPPPDMVVDLVSSCVGKHQPDEEVHYATTRALLLASRPLAPHETFNHPVGVLFAISSTTPDPMGTLQRLYGQAVGTGAQAAPWMDGVQVFKFFVVVHDVSKAGRDLEDAKELLQLVKKTYGPHSTLLVINSRVPPSSGPRSANSSPSKMEPPAPIPPPKDASPIAGKPWADPTHLSEIYTLAMANLTLAPLTAIAAAQDADESAPKKTYGALLAPEDVSRIVAMVRELVVQSLVPWMEARIREWNEAYQSNRRGLTGRLFGAGRKLFGGSRPTSPSPAKDAGYNAVKGFYPANSVEALSRRLADFAFMLRDYRYAAGVYDTLRRDYAQDRAWRYASAATEMYGLSTLLSHGYFLPTAPPGSPVPHTTLQHTDISSWLEQAVVAYNSRGAGQVQLDSLRATVLYYEAWKVLGEWRGVGAALVRAAGEADEVPCAVILEEAAAADTKGGKSNKGRRRQAQHLAMAARRYEKAGLKTYSRRCLEGAADLMRNAPWTAVRDRFEYSLGRQAYTQGESAEAVTHFLRLMQKDDTSQPGLQLMVLESLGLAYEQLASRPDDLEKAIKSGKMELPTPVFDITKTRVVLPAEPEGSSSSGGRHAKWAALDAQALAHWDRKGKKPMSVLPDRKRIIAAVGETLHAELWASNPLSTALVVSDITVSVDGAAADVETIKEVTLEPYETRVISVGITPKAAGAFTISAASFRFHGFLPITQSLERRGKRLHATKAQRLTPTYAKDTTLTVNAVEGAPRVVVTLHGVPDQLYEGEVVDATITLHNAGKSEVENVQAVCSHYGVISLMDAETSDALPNVIPTAKPFTLAKGIPAGETVAIPVRFTAVSAGTLELLSLIVYTALDGTPGATRLVHAADVRRVLTVTTEISPARSGYIVIVDIASHADTPITIADLTPVSQYWDAEGIPGAVLYPNQTFRGVIHPKPNGRTDLDLAQPGLVANLAALLRGNMDSLAPITPTEVSLSTPTGYFLQRRSHRLRFASANFSALASELVPKVLPMFDPLDLDVVFNWSIGDRHGHGGALGLRPSPAFSLVEALRAEADGPAKRTMYEETDRIRRQIAESVLEGPYAVEQDPVVVRARVKGASSGRVQHDFNNGALVLPVTIELQNRSPHLALRWIVRLPPPSDSGTLYTGSLASRGTLEPGAKTEVSAGVWVGEPGLVALSGWEVERETGDRSAQVQDQDQWLPRAAWADVGGAPSVEVVQAPVAVRA